MIGARSNPKNKIYYGAHASQFTSLSKDFFFYHLHLIEFPIHFNVKVGE
jgi:hypothetical protein